MSLPLNEKLFYSHRNVINPHLKYASRFAVGINHINQSYQSYQSYKFLPSSHILFFSFFLLLTFQVDLDTEEEYEKFFDSVEKTEFMDRTLTVKYVIYSLMIECRILLIFFKAPSFFLFD